MPYVTTSFSFQLPSDQNVVCFPPSGRTYPVDTFFLEDVYELTSYVLPDDHPSAYRRGAGEGEATVEAMAKNRKESKQLAEAWGSSTEGEVFGKITGPNPEFREDAFEGYSKHVKRSLSCLNEASIDYDLIQALIEHIHQNRGAHFRPLSVVHASKCINLDAEWLQS